MKFFLLIGFVFTIILAFAQPGSLDTTFNYNPNVIPYYLGQSGPDGVVNIIVKQIDGKIILGGEFNKYNGYTRKGIVRINSNGSVDETFIVGTGFSNSVKDIDIQTDGKIIVSGFFGTYNGVTANSIVRLNPNGSIDPSFDSGLGTNSAGIYNVVLTSEQKIVITGHFSTYDGQSKNSIARLNLDGTLDNSFLFSNPPSSIYSVAIQQDDKIIVCNPELRRINPDGSIDTNYNAANVNFSGGISTRLLLLSSGKLLVTGNFTGFNGISRIGIALFNEDGTLDESFDPGLGVTGGSANMDNPNNSDYLLFINNVFTMKERVDGKIILAGNFSSYNGVNCRRMAMINLDGSLFTPIDGYYYGYQFRTLLINDDLSYFAGGGYFGETEHIRRSYFGKYSSSGVLDLSYLPDNGADNMIRLIETQSDDKIMVAGLFGMYDNFLTSRLARLNENGSVDTSFQNTVASNGLILDLAIQADDKTIIVGDFTSTFLSPVNRIARLFSSGKIDTTFQTGTGADDYINQVEIQPDGKILLFGVFMNFNNNAVARIVRLNTDGSIDYSFNSSLALDTLTLNNPSTIFKAVTIQSDGKILVGTNSNQGIYRLNEDGSEDPTFNYNGTPFQPDDIDLTIDGKIVITYGGNIYRLFPNGMLDASFSNEISAPTYSTLIQPDGKIIVNCGNELVTLDANGHIDDRFFLYNTHPGWGYTPNVSGSISAIKLQSSGKLLVGGDFTYFQDIMSNSITRLNNINLQLTLDSIVDLGCNNSGQLFVSALFGTEPYSYEWINPPNVLSNQIAVDTEGVYICKATDFLGDTAFLYVHVDGPSTLLDLELNVTSLHSSFRPGFESLVWLNAFNDGCLPTSGQLKLAYDPLLDFVSSNPAPTSQNGDTLIWDFTSITYDSAHITPQIVFNTSVLAVIGDTIDFTTIITPIAGDADTTNNIKYYSSPVVNGYDPNIKSVYPVGKCDVGYIEQDQLLTYTVQFQNTGNSEAINITIIDPLSSNLDLNTVRVVGKSHEQWTEVLPGNVLKFHFDNINLPDSTSNEPASHGYVIFEVKPVSTWLNQNIEIANLADIYFDFNPAIRTNEVSNLIFQNGDLETYNCLGAGVNENSTNEMVVVYPNPTSGDVIIELPQSIENCSIIITDLQGKLIQSQSDLSGNKIQINLSSLNSGIYLITVSDATGINHTARIIKQ